MKVTLDTVKEYIVGEEYVKLGTKMTACTLTLKDGFEVVGIAGVVDAAEFNIGIGSRFAKEKAMDKVWQHLGSIEQYKIHMQKNKKKDVDDFLDEAVGHFVYKELTYAELVEISKDDKNGYDRMQKYTTEETSGQFPDDILEDVKDKAEELLSQYENTKESLGV